MKKKDDYAIVILLTVRSFLISILCYVIFWYNQRKLTAYVDKVMARDHDVVGNVM